MRGTAPFCGFIVDRLPCKSSSSLPSSFQVRNVDSPSSPTSSYMRVWPSPSHCPPSSSGVPSSTRPSVRPPTRSRASTTVTSCPRATSHRAAASPANPAPTTTTLLIALPSIPCGAIPSVQPVPASGSPAALACTPFPYGSSPPMIQAIRLMGWLVTAHAISHGRAASCAVCRGAVCRGEADEVGHKAHLVVDVLPAGLDGALETAKDLEAGQAEQVGPAGEDPFE